MQQSVAKIIRAALVFAALTLVPVPAFASAAFGIEQPEWEKVCRLAAKDMECLTSRQRIESVGQVLTSIKVVERGNNKVLQVATPPGALIQPGVQVSIDKAKPVTVAYVLCAPRECLALGEIDKEFVARLKKGRVLSINAIDPQGKLFSVDVSLTGFTKTYDSEGLDAAGAKAKDERLAAEQEDRAAATRQELLDAQREIRSR